jgi:hypothetical protein
VDFIFFAPLKNCNSVATRLFVVKTWDSWD